MIHERGIFRAPDKDGGAGSGANLPLSSDKFIFSRVAEEGQVPHDADDVRQKLAEMKEMYGQMGVSREDIEVLVKRLENGFKAFDNGDLPVDFLRNGGFNGGNRMDQVRTGEHIMRVHKMMSQAMKYLP